MNELTNLEKLIKSIEVERAKILQQIEEITRLIG
jgi:hypothetical protein